MTERNLKTKSGLAFALAAGAICIIVLAYLEIRQERRTITALNDKIAAILNTTHSNVIVPPTSPKEIPLPSSLQPTPVLAAPTKAPPTGSPVVLYNEIARSNPDFDTLYRKRIRRTMLAPFRDLLPRLNLSRERLEKVENLLVDRYWTESDAWDVLEASGVKLGSEEFVAAMKKAKQDIEIELRSSLGEDYDALINIPALAKYENVIASNFSSDFSDAGSPLNETQKFKLARVMLSTLGNTPDNYEEQAVDPRTGLRAVDALVLDAVTPYVDANQKRVLLNRYIEDNKMRLIMRNYPRDAGITMH